MPNFISEDNIEQAILQRLQFVHGYDVENFHTDERDDLNDGSRRTSKRDVILLDRLRNAALRLNPDIPQDAIDGALTTLCERRRAMPLVAANREVYELLRDGVRVEFRDATGKNRVEQVRIIDFNDKTGQANEFLAVSQMWIQGEVRYRRPDILLYVNGLPLVFFELKNSNVKLRTAYDDNLTNYKADIPQLFLTNAFCVLSNAIDTRVGSITAGWQHFFRWLRPDDEKEKIDREKIRREGTSAERLLAGLCAKEKLLDYLENFILYYRDTQKIIAQNHQFIGVNKSFARYVERGEADGKLGVFWHTQGSGKSYSMIFYTRKILRKCGGSPTFVVVTDRDDLDGQIYRTFLHTGTVKQSDAAQPKNGEEMRKFLGQSKRLVFTLIQKFHWPRGQQYPLLSERDDIIVIVDEAHRTQYKTFAENMRTGLPNARYLAFTGTPLLGSQRKTNAWFGDYVSEYNFRQSMDDGATLPLFYKKRVPEMHNQNENLDAEFYEILEDENLDPAQKAKLEDKFANELEVIRRADRLEAIARDIVFHFSNRGYLGKGVVISVDKLTAVKTHNHVQRLWKEEIRNLLGKINKSSNPVEKERLKRRVEYMRSVKMAVVISEDANEEEYFKEHGIEIQPHRERINALDDNGHDIEHNFKDPAHELQLVFVCAMWLTGFDAPTVSALYLDKPQKDHTLMQTITRANRVTSWTIRGVEKHNGEVIDYYGVRLKKALNDYGEGGTSEDAPVKDKDELFRMLDEAIALAKDFCTHRGIHIDKALESADIFRKVTLFEDWADRLLTKDDDRKAFNVFENTITVLYEASKPEIIGMPQVRTVAVFQYLRGVLDGIIQQQDIESARQRVRELLDESLVVSPTGQPLMDAKGTFTIQQKGKVWDLSKVDFDKLRKDFKAATHKNIQIADMRAFLEKKLLEMLKHNRTRGAFAERLQAIIDEYNSGSSSTDRIFEELTRYLGELGEEAERHTRKGLTEDELEIYDLLKKEKMTQAEEKKVRLAAKALLKRLLEEPPRVLVQDWFRDGQTRLIVRDAVGEVLHNNLPESYDRALFTEKRDSVFELVLDLAEHGSKWAA